MTHIFSTRVTNDLDDSFFRTGPIFISFLLMNYIEMCGIIFKTLDVPMFIISHLNNCTNLNDLVSTIFYIFCDNLVGYDSRIQSLLR